MKYPSLKKYICESFAMVPNLKGFENNYVIFVTSIGIIQGKPVTNEEIKSEQDQNILLHSTLLSETEKRYNEQNDLQNELLPDNDGYILLKDVTITSDSTYNLGCMTLFYDQIIAVSCGKFEH